MAKERTFPKLSHAQRIGAAGVNIVTRLVEERLGWRFRRNHQEDDFGIDGYIDLVSDDGEILGKTIGVQIKTGQSHIQSETPNGFRLSGERKHLNYFLNSLVPIILILVDEKNENAWWIHIRPQAVLITGKGWSIWMPKSQRLDSSTRAMLAALAGAVIDYGPLVKQMNAVRQAAGKFDVIVLIISKKEIRENDVSRVVEYFDMFEAAPDQLTNIRNKLVLLVNGYDDDRRELFEIQEVRKWYDTAEHAVIGWAYYLAMNPEYSTLPVFLACTSSFEVIGASPKGDRKFVSIPPPEVSAFLRRHFGWLNEFTEKHGISEAINREVSEAMSAAVFRIVRLDRG